MSPAIIVYYLISINFDSKNARKMPKLNKQIQRIYVPRHYCLLFK